MNVRFRPVRLCFYCITVVVASAEVTEASEIDDLLASEVFHDRADVRLAPRTSDELFLRRVYLDIVGEHPTPAEITGFVLDPSPDKRTAIVDKLLDDPRYGLNWARYWRDVIIARRSVTDVNILGIVGQPLESFLMDRLNRNVGWDEIARAFVEAEGVMTDHGETALFAVHQAQTSAVAAETSRIFLGIQIQCAECHDHPFDQWKRPQFHEFAAFFPRIGIQRGKNAEGKPTLSIASIDSNPQARRPDSRGDGREHYMPDIKDPTARGTLMTPVFFATGDRLESGAPDADRRRSLADWMTSKKNPWFAKALVNRMWSELVGEGFYEPVDDLGPDRECAAPKTLDRLAADFAASDYDLKQLLRTILATDAYQRESRPRRSPDEPPFAANVSQRLRADQLIDVLSGALGYQLGGVGRGGMTTNVTVPYNSGPRGQLVQLFGYDPSMRREQVASSIPQALMLMNSSLVNVGATTSRSAWLGRVLDSTPSDDGAVIELYLRCLAREPNDDELAVCLEHVKTKSRSAAFDDLFWSLLNSEELRFRD